MEKLVNMWDYCVPESVLDERGPVNVEAWIRERGLSWRLIDTGGPTTSVADAAERLGVEPGVIVKTLVLIDGEKTYAVIVPGPARLDLGKLARVVGGKPRMARPREVLERTGYRVGGVPPVALPEDVVLVVDKAVLGLERVYGGGGRDGVLLEFSPAELVRETGCLVADVSSR